MWLESQIILQVDIASLMISTASHQLVVEDDSQLLHQRPTVSIKMDLVISSLLLLLWMMMNRIRLHLLASATLESLVGKLALLHVLAFVGDVILNQT